MLHFVSTLILWLGRPWGVLLLVLATKWCKDNQSTTEQGLLCLMWICNCYVFCIFITKISVMANRNNQTSIQYFWAYCSLDLHHSHYSVIYFLSLLISAPIEQYSQNGRGKIYTCTTSSPNCQNIEFEGR